MTAQEKILQTLRREFQLRKLKNPAYSLRAFARDLNLQPSGLSEILSGKRGLTRNVGLKLSARLDVPEAASLVRDLKGRNERGTHPFSQLERDTFQMIADWHYFAILSLAETADFQPDSAWVAQRLGIPPGKAAEALATLERLELLVRRGGRLAPSGKRFCTTTDIADIAIQRAHRQNLDLASQALQTVPVDERDFSLMSIAIDPKRIPGAKEKLRKFRRALATYLEGGSEKTEVYRLSFQLFPLTRSVRKGNL
jgi:hypothetical protein